MNKSDLQIKDLGDTVDTRKTGGCVPTFYRTIQKRDGRCCEGKRGNIYWLLLISRVLNYSVLYA